MMACSHERRAEETVSRAWRVGNTFTVLHIKPPNAHEILLFMPLRCHRDDWMGGQIQPESLCPLFPVLLMIYRSYLLCNSDCIVAAGTGTFTETPSNPTASGRSDAGLTTSGKVEGGEERREHIRRLGGRCHSCSMDISQLCSILAACISDNPQQRKAAEATLAQVKLTALHITRCSYALRCVLMLLMTRKATALLPELNRELSWPDAC